MTKPQAPNGRAYPHPDRPIANGRISNDASSSTKTLRKRTSDLSIEKAIVGAAMRDRAEFEKLAKIIRRPDVFHSFAHQCVWRALTKMACDESPFDGLTVREVLTRMGVLDDVRPGYIVELWGDAPSLSVDHHARTVVELHAKREAVEWAKRFTDDLEDAAAAPFPLIEQAKAQLDRLAALSFGEGDGAADDDGRRGYQPFPVELLPTSLQDFILAAKEALYCDAAFIGVPALVAIGAAIGNAKTVAVKDSWYEPSVFWAAIVADSSSLKSPSMDLAICPLWSMQRKLSLEYEDDFAYWKRAYADWSEQRFKRRKEQPGTDVNEREPAKPNPKKLLVNDITIERLAQVLHQNPHGVCLVRDELAGWFGSFGRYSDKGGGSDMATWLEMFRAKTLTIDRKTGEPPTLFIPRAACSVVGTIQPRILQRILTDDFFDSGLASRLLLCMPPRKAKVWTEDTVPDSVYDAYSNNIKNLYLSGLEITEGGDKSGRQVGFTKAGKKAWIEFYAEWADRQSNSQGETAYALAKLEAYCARFALLLCCYDKADYPGKREEINEGHVKKAFGLVQWFANEAERVYRMVRSPAEKQGQERMIEFIMSIGGKITVRRLMRANPSKYPTAEDATRVLEGLAEKGVGKWVTMPSDETGGKPTRALQISPDNLTT